MHIKNRETDIAENVVDAHGKKHHFVSETSAAILALNTEMVIPTDDGLSTNNQPSSPCRPALQLLTPANFPFLGSSLSFPL